ncbi:AGE family epimerase/isomerase [Tianweitania sp.]|uniref:AGE family epimerase/isomerase n=1 Tax=Tianweitania sp. TaxID=2021634 RepID=UPI00289C5D5D|nr:AGE family epimerase/isomerase [Tianweitania sp.]
MTLASSPMLPTSIVPNANALVGLAFHRFKTWMLDLALPFWSTTGLSPDGGVVECLSLDGRPARPGFKRVRVHARQIYVFSHAHILGVPDMLPAARHGVDFLLRHGRDHAGGWVVKMGEAGGVVDSEVDLYDQAFVILALVWWHKASGEHEALALARDTLAMIETRFARADGQGFLCRLPDRGGQLQNPHMHMLESVLALHEVMPTEQSDRVIRMLLRLFETHLFDAETGTLGEHFDQNWHAPADETGDRLEPGHHYEWVWLLHRARQLGYAVEPSIPACLLAFAETYGLAPGSALIHDEVARDGRILASGHRSWPQTERIKALITRGETTGQWPHPDIFQALDALWTHYIAPAPQGGWIDHITAEGKACVSAVPASTLYHLFLAYAELDRTAHALFGTA